MADDQKFRNVVKASILLRRAADDLEALNNLFDLCSPNEEMARVEFVADQVTSALKCIVFLKETINR